MTAMRIRGLVGQHEPQRGSFYKTANNNGLARGLYEDASPIYHCSCSMQVRKQAASI